MHADAYCRAIPWGLKLTTGTESEPFTTAEAKAYLRAFDGEETLIDALVTTARKKLERDTRRPGITQEFEYALDAVPGRRAPIQLPVAPVSGVTITAYDTVNVATVVDADSYRLDTHSLPHRLVLNDGYDWPTGLRETQGLIVTIIAGYGAAYSAITDPEWMQAIRLLLAHWYDNRSAVELGTITAVVPLAYDFLIDGLVVPFGVVA